MKWKSRSMLCRLGRSLFDIQSRLRTSVPLPIAAGKRIEAGASFGKAPDQALLGARCPQAYDDKQATVIRKKQT